MKKLLLGVMALSLLLSAPAFAAGVHYDTVGHHDSVMTPTTSQKTHKPAAQSWKPDINFSIGTRSPSEENQEYPHGRNNIRPRNDTDESVIPTLKEFICTGTNCTCGGSE